MLRLLPTTGRGKDIEILVLRYQIGVLQRQLGDTRVRFGQVDRVLLAALLYRLPRRTLRRLRLRVRPDTILRWHRDLLRQRHATPGRSTYSAAIPTRCTRPRHIDSSPPPTRMGMPAEVAHHADGARAGYLEVGRADKARGLEPPAPQH
ncbi:hypothetical protein [Actinocrispum wychmicini]|uniref:Uncharacterized protein n=1 Tax=Actinocrispum wychmicini TaxID=1213861 RepID=A0A4R2JFS0_9PSEU|nr:hypothetical protein [Actinocrispum wychmicini]TCO55708.1 hypothetical protein EV192_107130 [Actinocrispum wychmicini]